MTARASPTMAGYCVSDGWRKLIPTRHNLQPVGQQVGSLELHEHDYCKKKKPIPTPKKSVARHVGRVGSNKWTPSIILSTISFLDLTNCFCNSSVHSNLTLGFSKSPSVLVYLGKLCPLYHTHSTAVWSHRSCCRHQCMIAP